MSAEIVHLVTEGPDWTALAGIIGAGVFGLLGGWVTDVRRSAEDRRKDERQFDHDRRLKSVDDLVSQIDEVEAALEELGEKCATMRQLALTHGDDPKEVGPSVLEAQDSYQRARASIARLGIRPHAGRALVEKASAAAGHYLEAYRVAHQALVGRRLGAHRSAESMMAITHVPEHVERGIEATREYEAAAREALEGLLGSPSDR